MATTEIPVFHSMLGAIAQGALAGQQAAQQENDADQQRSQEMGLRVASLAQNLQQQYGEQQQAPWQALAGHLSGFTPGSQATILQNLGAPPTGVAPGILGLQKVFPRGTAAGNLLNQYGQPAPAANLPQPPVTAGAAPAAPPGQPQPPGTRGAGGPGMGVPVAGGMLAPPAAGGAPQAPAPVPGQTTFPGPGGVPLTLGADPRQRNLLAGEVSRLAARFGGKDMPEDFRATTGGLVKQANAQLAAGDLEGARATIGQLQYQESQIPAQTQRGAAVNANTLLTTHRQQQALFQGKDLSPDAAYAAITNLGKNESQLSDFAAAHPELSVPSVGVLDEYQGQIAQMQQDRAAADALRAKKARTPAEDRQLAAFDKSWRGAAQDLHDALHYGVSPKNKASVVPSLVRLMESLPPDQRSPENAAAAVEKSDPGLAALIRARGLRIGGAAAEKETDQLVRGLPSLIKQGVPPAAMAAYVDRLRIASQLTGHPITLDASALMYQDPAAKPGTPQYQKAQDAHDRALLEIDKDKQALKLDGTKWQLANVSLDLKRVELDQKTGKLPDPNLLRNIAVKKMSQAQHETDAAWQLYQKYLSQNPAVTLRGFDPQQWLKTHAKGDYAGLDVTTARGVKLYRDYNDLVYRQSRLFDQLEKSQPKWRQELTENASAGTPPPAARQQRQAQPQAQSQRAGGMRSITAGGRTFQINPAQFDAQARASGRSEAWIQQQHKLFGF